MDRELKCKKRCCVLRFTTSIHNFEKEKNALTSEGKKRQSAGIAIVTENTENRRILLTQSYNNLWGVPKGKKEGNETILECASREVVEESGVKIPSSSLKTCEEFIFVPSYDKKLTIHIFKYVMPTMEYVLSEMEKMNIDNLHQDSTGVGWICIDCLKDVVKAKKIKLNALTKFILKKI